MQYKGYLPQKKQTPPDRSLGDAMFGTVAIFNDLKSTKEDLINKVDEKIFDVENRTQKLEEKIKDVDNTLNKAEDTLNNTVKEALDYVKEIKQGESGEDGKDAEEIDQEKLIKDILDRLPKPEKFDEKALIKKVITAIPKNKASLKIIQETFETDPMSVIDKIMALPEDKFKLKSTQIDGLEQTISAFRSQLARGYLHGGGDTVKAGTNVTITKNSDGTKTISASDIIGTPAGSSYDVQVNSGGVFGAVTSNATSSQKFLTQTGDGVNSTIPTWTIIPSQSTLNTYMTNTASDVAGLYKSLKTPDIAKTTFTTVSVSTGSTLLRTWITEPSNPGVTFIPQGQYDFKLNALKASGTKVIHTYCELWEANSSGTDIALIGTTAYSNPLTTLEVSYATDFVTANNYIMASTASRLKIKVYAHGEATGSAPDVSIFYGGTATTRFSVPSSSGSTLPAGSNTQIQFNDSGAFGANANFVFDKATGNVGIGTGSPVSLLDVNGNITGSATSGYVLNGYYSSGWKYRANGYLNTMYQTGAGDFNFDTAPVNAGGAGAAATITTRMTILNGGNVGIGTTGPGTALQVREVAVNNNYPTLGTASGVFSILSNEAKYGLFAGVNNGSGNVWMQAQRSDGTATAYSLVLQPSGGNVGIGTTNPLANLHVWGGDGGAGTSI
ncbi:MAG: hypothetical protein WCO06_01550, partial [Candidatus Roizmanbacteria bacterium]